MTIRSWVFLPLLFCFGCALPPDLKEAGDRFVYVLEGESRASREDLSPTPVENEAETSLPVMVDMQMKPKESSSPAMTSKAAPISTETSITPTIIPLSELDYSLDASALPSIYEQKPQVVEKTSVEPAPAYKVITVGEEEIRVIDKDMGSVEKADLEILRTQVGK